MEYGTKLLVLRAAWRLTQAEAAKKAGITEKQLGLMESGRMLPGPEMKARIAIALDWPSEELAEVAFGILEGDIDSVQKIVEDAIFSEEFVYSDELREQEQPA